jgi:hypothetical protein
MASLPKKTTKSLYSGVSALLFLAVFCSSAKFQNVNFSGIWKVDSLKTNYGGFEPAGTAVALKIVQSKDTISIRRTLRRFRGDTLSFTYKLSLDGKTMTETRGTAKSSQSIKWTGRSLFETSSVHDDAHNGRYEATETWTLSPDGRTLTDDRVVTNDGNGGHGVSKAVYNRQ